MVNPIPLSVFVNAALYTGLIFLQGKVLYSIFVYDMPGIADGKSSTSTTTSSQKTKEGGGGAALQSAFDYYTTRKTSDPSYYAAVPVGCILLTTGVFTNVYVQGASWSSLTTLLVAFGTALNNGKNVVDPINAVIDDPKGDKKGGGSLDDNNKDFADVLEGVTKGHWIDVIGFTTLFLTFTFL